MQFDNIRCTFWKWNLPICLFECHMGKNVISSIFKQKFENKEKTPFSLVLKHWHIVYRYNINPWIKVLNWNRFVKSKCQATPSSCSPNRIQTCIPIYIRCSCSVFKRIGWSEQYKYQIHKFKWNVFFSETFSTW